MVVLEELGRGLMPEPLLSTVLARRRQHRRGGSKAQRDRLLPPLVGGELLRDPRVSGTAQSLQSVPRRDQSAEQSGNGWALNGEKIQVLDGVGADRLIVPARTAR